MPFVPNIDIDNYKASYEAVDYLIKTGHKKIGVIRADKDDNTCIDRLKGYKKVLSDNLMIIDERYIVDSDFHFQAAYDGMMSVLRIGEKPDAMFCFSDELATGAIKAIIDSGLKVPEDISIVGFDDIPLAKRFIPSITTVKQPIFKMGKIAMETVYKMINKDENDTIMNTTLNHEVIVRDSTRERN